MPGASVCSECSSQEGSRIVTRLTCKIPDIRLEISDCRPQIEDWNPRFGMNLQSEVCNFVSSAGVLTGRRTL